MTSPLPAHLLHHVLTGGFDLIQQPHLHMQHVNFHRPHRDLHVHCVRGEEDHDRQHGHGFDGDAPGEEEEEDQAADQQTHGHGDAHVQLPGQQQQQHKPPQCKFPFPL